MVGNVWLATHDRLCELLQAFLVRLCVLVEEKVVERVLHFHGWRRAVIACYVAATFLSANIALQLLEVPWREEVQKALPKRREARCAKGLVKAWIKNKRKALFTLAAQMLAKKALNNGLKCVCGYALCSLFVDGVLDVVTRHGNVGENGYALFEIAFMDEDAKSSLLFFNGS